MTTTSRTSTPVRRNAPGVSVTASPPPAPAPRRPRPRTGRRWLQLRGDHLDVVHAAEVRERLDVHLPVELQLVARDLAHAADRDAPREDGSQLARTEARRGNVLPRLHRMPLLDEVEPHVAGVAE